MKKIASIILIALCWFITSCGNADNSPANKIDTVREGNEPPAGPAPDNSNATNPSLKDTMYTDSAR